MWARSVCVYNQRKERNTPEKNQRGGWGVVVHTISCRNNPPLEIHVNNTHPTTTPPHPPHVRSWGEGG